MNFTPVYGWYYLSDRERTASWTGVEFFYNFIVGNRGVGPFGREVEIEALKVGDVIQLAREREGYYHTLLVLERVGQEIYVAAHSNDVYDRPLSSYNAPRVRFLHVEGVRIDLPAPSCFEALIQGEALPVPL